MAKRVVYRGIEGLKDEPADVFWLAGFVRNESNEWWVRTVFRGRHTGKIFEKAFPIGMLPVLALGTCFDRDLLKYDQAVGERGRVVVPDLSRYELITSADIPNQLYPLPSQAGIQKLFRYQTDNGDVLVPVVELVRALFVHNRTLALALMRPAGLEQLFYPETPESQGISHVRFTREMPRQSLNKQFVREFAWIAFDQEARRSWDSVQRLTSGQRYVMFDPPPIRQSMWSFRGVRAGGAWFVLGLHSVSGRQPPFAEIYYSHPGFVHSLRGTADGAKKSRTGSNGKSGGIPFAAVDIAYELADDEAGSGSYRNIRTVDARMKESMFDSDIRVHKVFGDIAVEKDSNDGRRQERAQSTSGQISKKMIRVTAGERARNAPLPALDFKTLSSVPLDEMGDLEALDMAVRYMRDLLPCAEIHMALTQLKPGRAISACGGRPRPAMVVVIRTNEIPPIALVDIERTGVEALSLMTLRFVSNVTPLEIEDAVQQVLGGLVDRGGHWSVESEHDLKILCKAERVPRVLIPRSESHQFGKRWAYRLIRKLGLSAGLQMS